MKNSMPEITARNAEEISTYLNKLLADEYVLYTKTRNAHWNATGPGFSELHHFFEIQYKVLDVMIDDIAERIRSLGHFALGSMKDFLSVTRMSEDRPDFGTSTEIVQTLVADHETIIRTILYEIISASDKYTDQTTSDLVSGLIEQHEKMAWMLRAFLTEPDFSATRHIRTVTNHMVVNYQ
jgi:starvation-inducible DNA-binding protein